MGGTKTNPAGTLADVVLLDASELEEAPSHLSDAEAAALPLTGLTAWRAVFTKSGNAKPGHNILITGIGGGVALMALSFAVAQGCNVYVTSGNEEKIQQAKALGAKGGVIYKEQGWDKKLQGLLPKDRPTLDAIIDGAGGDVVAKGSKLLKVWSIVFCLEGMLIKTERRHHIHLRHDREPEDGLSHVRSSSQPGSSRFNYGLTKRVHRNDRLCRSEEDQACGFTDSQRSRHRGDRQFVRRHEGFQTIWKTCCHPW